MDSLLLALDTWDLVLNAQGNIAAASAPYSMQQDVACAVRTYLGECYFNTSLGIPYNEEILGQRPPLQLLKAKYEAASLAVPGVQAANCVFTSFDDRALHGRIELTDTTGTITYVHF